jgi:hypothetical protein
MSTVLMLVSLLQPMEIAPLAITSPVPYQVIQRTGYNPLQAHHNAAGGPQLGAAEVAITFTNELAGTTTEVRTLLLKDAFGTAVDWTPLVNGRVKLPAGGWYRLEVRQRKGTEVVAAGAVEPIGVGEVIVVAGQSYSTNTNDEQLKVTEPQGRVVAFNHATKTWQVAHDPQPAGDGSQKGSIWPPVGDALVPLLRCPVAFANVGVGATSSAQWQPGGPLYDRLVQTGTHLGRFRAVTWQQGESDVIAKTTLAQYQTNLRTLRSSSAKAWGFEPTWLLAKSTLHPTVYNEKELEGRIREALEGLSHEPGFQPGPDTDILGAENRGDIKSARHFSPIGQRRAALMWTITLWNEIQRQSR